MNITDTMFLQVDKLGNAPNNLITQEEHILPSNGKIIKPNFLAYYTDSLVVTAIDSSNNQRTLTYLTDYIYTDHFHNLSANTGKQICGSILLDDDINETIFKIQYQTYGGLDHPDIKQIAIAVAGKLQANSVDWNSIIDKPIGFTPNENHLHDWLDLYGLEYIVNALIGIKQAINLSPSYKQLGLSTKIQEIFSSYPINTRLIQIDNTHTSNMLNIHDTTKADIGLGNVQNLKVFNTYTPYINNPSTASIFKDFNQSSEIRYITPISAANYIIESINEVKKQLFTNSNSTVNLTRLNLTSIDSKASQALVQSTNNQSAITLLTNTINLIKTKHDSISVFVNRYKLLNQNEELATIVKAISQHKYNSDNSYSALYDLPNKLPDLYFWIDFSDLSKLTINNNTIQNSISSITDKSINQRIFSQPNQANRPVLIQNTNLGNSQINKNNSVNLTQGKFISQVSGPSITLSNDCTIISLYKNKTSENVLLSSTLNSNTLNGHLEQRSVSLLTNKFLLKSNQGSSINYTSVLNILSISNTKLEQCWCATNDYYNTAFPLGLDIKNKTNSLDFTFNTIGSTSANHNYELSEILIYNRQLSIKEIDAITKYLSKKWSGSTDFIIPTSFVSNNI